MVTHRFERLRAIIQSRNRRIKSLEEQAVRLFEEGKLDEIEALMRRKESILRANRRLTHFIEKWERKNTSTDENITS